jgi:bisphosphoglycerate-independent phosphoglycerate mutase (AlkP superfamily)
VLSFLAILNNFCICFSDTAIGRVAEACAKHNYVCMVTADHGNAEQMYDEKGGKHTAHTCNKGLVYSFISSN